MKIPTILEYYDSKNSCCSYWRGRGVLSLLCRDGYVNLIEGTWNDQWDTINFADIAFFQRPMNKECLKQIATCKDYGLKIIIDLDDYNFISPSHPVYKVWCDIYDDNIFRKIMLLADIATVSTKVLQQYYLTYSNNVKIVPNAIDDSWLKFKPISNNKIVLIRAGDHHLSDIWYYRREIESVMKNHKDWKLQVLGCEVDFLKGLSNYEYAGDYNIHDYFAYILNARPSIFIV